MILAEDVETGPVEAEGIRSRLILEQVEPPNSISKTRPFFRIVGLSRDDGSLIYGAGWRWHRRLHYWLTRNPMAALTLAAAWGITWRLNDDHSDVR